MLRLVRDLAVDRVSRYFSEDPVGVSAIPRIYPPAKHEELVALEQRSGQLIEATYRDFLSLTDGMDGFHLDMSVLGCKDIEGGVLAKLAARFLQGVREDVTTEDVGLPAEIGLFPIAVNGDCSRAIFMIDAPDILPERIWWVGEGDSMFFGTFADLLSYALDRLSYNPRETVD